MLITASTTDARLPMQWETEDGNFLELRHIHNTDTHRLIAFVRQLTFSAKYFRFGHGDYDPSEEEVRHVCTPDPEQCIHLVVVVHRNDEEQAIGSARYVIQSDGVRGEFAIAVLDSWKEHGIGHRLMNALFQSGRSRGAKEMFGYILTSNLRMIEFVKGCGFKVADSLEGQWLKVASISL